MSAQIAAAQWTPWLAVRSFIMVMMATARVYIKSFASNIVMLIRGPVNPVLGFLSFWLVYRISGQSEVPADQVPGFLIIGGLASLAWSSAIWACGFGLQMEAHQGTLPAVFASPANRIALVCGYGVGNLLIWTGTGVSATLFVGWLVGAKYDVANPLLAVLCFLLVVASVLCIGIAFGGLFMLSRNANPLANFLQTPIYLLAGFYIPRSVLPSWLQPVAGILPITHAIDAFRVTTLSGAGWGDVRGDLGWTVVTAIGFLIIGVISMKRVEYAVRTSGALNLF